jgi:hypothetical protein
MQEFLPERTDEALDVDRREADRRDREEVHRPGDRKDLASR